VSLTCKICGFTTEIMKNSVFWDVTPCGSHNIWRFRGTNRLHHQVKKVTGNVVPSSLILFILMMEAIIFPENADSYKSYTASYHRRRNSSCN
jgi:hypothetical protein